MSKDTSHQIPCKSTNLPGSNSHSDEQSSTPVSRSSRSQEPRASSNSPRPVILPGSTIGLLGGGQLGRMLALAAKEMGYKVACLDPDPQCPASSVSDHYYQYPFDSLQGASELSSVSDVITYEFENVSAEIARHLEDKSYLPQGYQLLYNTKHRLREKASIEAAGVPVAPYCAVGSFAELREAVSRLGLPAVLKTCEGGYDGKGQWVLQVERDVAELGHLFDSSREFVLESFVPFAKELSVIVARNPSGDIATFPVGENIHHRNILHMTIAPARIEPKTALQAREIALSLAEHFQLVGLLAIELFMLADGRLLVNELAPRPHNSGHYTQQACVTSQFEQHIRAVCNLPLAHPRLLTPTVMVNLLGEHMEQLTRVYGQLSADMKVHLYEKVDVRPLRKMGHVNIVADGVEAAMRLVEATKIWRS